jgi:hypothetical protein
MGSRHPRWSVAAVCALSLALAACGDDSEPTTADLGVDPTELGMPADADPVTTPEGDTVYLSESRVTVYGACETIDPHKDDVSGWLGIDPPRTYSDFGVVCR